MKFIDLFSRKKLSFFAESEEQRMVEAIRSAEKQTSGEIRLYVESRCTFINPVDRAIELFGELNMHQTKDRSAVIVYVAMKDRQLAIFGDEGIHQRLGNAFWEAEVKKILSEFGSQNYVEGIIKIITDIGEALKHHFPHESDDKNELTDEIAFGR